MRRLSVNLATTPFVNRVVPLTTVSVVLGLALLFTLFNLAAFVFLGNEYRTDRKLLADQAKRLEELKRDMNEKEKILRSASVASFSEESKYISTMLDEKRFSWIRFLEDLEKVKPYGVMFLSVSPQVTKEMEITLSLHGVANRRDELLKLEQNMFASPLFKIVQLHSEQRQSGNALTDFSVTCTYLPEVSDAP